jgi:hypothetical protein
LVSSKRLFLGRGVDFGEILSPFAKLISRFILFVVAAFDFEVEQKDVKTTFLDGDLEEEIYMKQLEGRERKS